MTDSQATPEPVTGPGQPGPVPPGASGPRTVDTANQALHDGVNRCPKCGSTEIQLRVSAGKLVCLFCRYEWSEAKIEPVVAGESALQDLTGMVVASGATDISPEVSGVITLKCPGCGSEVV